MDRQFRNQKYSKAMADCFKSLQKRQCRRFSLHNCTNLSIKLTSSSNIIHLKPNEWNVWIDWRTSAPTSGCQHRPTRPKQWQSLPSCRFLARSSFYLRLDLLYPKHLTFVLSNSLLYPSLSQIADLGAWYILILFFIFLSPKHLTFVLGNSLLYLKHLIVVLCT